MKKVSFADTAKIDKKQDGSIVVSLYVHDKKDKVEYFKTLPKTQETDTNKTKKRTVKVKKSEKAKHREKLRVSSFLEADNWEYVLRVPVTGVDHATTWKKFKERYSYKHKDRPLKYVMVKCDGELYGVIKNAPIDGDKIPLVNIEHSIVSGFDSSMIDRIAKMTLKYKGTGDSYVKSQHLKTKKYKYVNLGGIDEFILPDNALVTRGHASIVFSGGTAEENEQAVMRFLKEKRVQEVDKYTEHLMKELNKLFPYCNRFRIIAPSVAGMVANLDISDPKKIMFEGRERTLVEAKYKGQTVYCEIDGEPMMDRHPAIYVIFDRYGKIYYVGLAKEPLNRYCDHFGINKYGKDNNNSDFYRYVNAKGLDFSDFSILFFPVTGFCLPDSGLWLKTTLTSSFNEDAPEDIALISKAEMPYKGNHADELAEGDEAFVQCEYYNAYLRGEMDLFIAENGLPLYWKSEQKKQDAIERAKKSFWCVKAEVKEGEKPYYYDVQALVEEMRWRFNIKNNVKDAIFDLEKMFYEIHRNNVEAGFYDATSPVFREIVKKQADFLRLNIDVDDFISRVDSLTMPQ